MIGKNVLVSVGDEVRCDWRYSYIPYGSICKVAGVTPTGSLILYGIRGTYKREKFSLVKRERERERDMDRKIYIQVSKHALRERGYYTGIGTERGPKEPCFNIIDTLNFITDYPEEIRISLEDSFIPSCDYFVIETDVKKITSAEVISTTRVVDLKW